MAEPTLFDLSQQGKRCITMPQPARAPEQYLPEGQLRAEPPALPEVSEPEIARHYARLAAWNFNVDRNFYPLGSCTMKYNPRANEAIAAEPGWARLHPAAPEECVQGALRLMRDLEAWLAAILGMDAVSLQPPAGAAGEFTSLRVFRAWHDSRGDTGRRRVIVPDTAHGTNPASVARCGWDVTVLTSDEEGHVSPDALRDVLGDDVAAIMLTNPNTLGLFETHVLEIAEMAHEAGALMYCDGANLNALLGHARPGDMGFDAVHVNLHKTFSTPHGGGGPGSGPIAVVATLEPFLPTPRLRSAGEGARTTGLSEGARTTKLSEGARTAGLGEGARTTAEGALEWDWDRPQSIGKVQAWFGNFLVAVRAWAYIRSMGAEGLRQATEDAVLAANYIRQALEGELDLPYPAACMHECVFSAKTLADEHSVHAADIAKRLLDYGIHPPTMYFPLIVEEALMIEPTETESKATLDRFIEVMREILRAAGEQPELLHEAPHTTPVRRVDEVNAARKPVLRWSGR